MSLRAPKNVGAVIAVPGKPGWLSLVAAAVLTACGGGG